MSDRSAKQDMQIIPGVHNRGVYNDFHVCRILTQFFAARAMPEVYARSATIGFPLSSVRVKKAIVLARAIEKKHHPSIINTVASCCSTE